MQDTGGRRYCLADPLERLRESLGAGCGQAVAVRTDEFTVTHFWV